MSSYSRTVTSSTKKEAFKAELNAVLGKRGISETYAESTEESSQMVVSEEYGGEIISSKDIFVAKHDFVPDEQDGINLRKGDKVLVLKTERSDSKKPKLDPDLDLGNDDVALLDNAAAKHKMSIRPRRKHADSRHKETFADMRWLVQIANDPSRQGWVPATLLTLHEDPPENPKEARYRREAVISELVETEEEFGRDIQQVVDHYLKPLDSKSVPTIVRENKELIFGNLKQIAELHNSVLIEGIKYYANEPRMLGKTFIRLERDFDKHVAYCRDEPTAQEFLQENDVVRDFFEEVSQRLGDDKSLSEHLKLPIQRINDYQLLLKELVKYSSILGDDTTDLGKALELMLAVPHRANDNKFISNIEGYHGNIHKLGRLLKHDWFAVTDRDGKSKDRYLFLFKARILICKVRRIAEERFVFVLKDIIRLPEVEVKDHVDDCKVFELHHKQPGFGVYPLTISAHKDNIKTAWLTEIREHASDVLALAEHAADDLRLETQSVDHKNIEPLKGIALQPATPDQVLPPVEFNNTTRKTAAEEIQKAVNDRRIVIEENNSNSKETEGVVCGGKRGKEEGEELPSEKKIKTENQDEEMDRFSSSRRSMSSRRVEEFRSVSSTSSQEIHVETASARHQLTSSSSSSRSMKMAEESASINGQTVSQLREGSGDVDGFSSIQEIAAGSRGGQSYTAIEEVRSGTRGSRDLTSSRSSVDYNASTDVAKAATEYRRSLSSSSAKLFAKPIGGMGGKAVFECEVESGCRVTWLKDNRPLPEGQSHRFTIVSSDSSHRLEIADVTDTDTGIYTARAKNTKGLVSSCTAQLAIDKKVGEESKDQDGGDEHAPFFIVHLHDTQLLENTYLRFMIKVKGKPNPDVKFYKDDVLITSVNARVAIVRDNAERGFYELVIADVQQEDAGTYKCIASNTHGQVECESVVTVTDEKKLFVGLDDDEKLLAPGETPHFTWLRDGQPFDPEERFKVLFKDEEDSLALVFQHVKPEDAGLYTCVASTSTGKISCSAELTVKGAINQLMREPLKPKIITEIKTQEASIGGSAMLELKIEGYPKPEIMWTKGDEEIKADSRHKFLYEDEESMSLVIKNVQQEDEGDYQVKAVNDLGMDSEVIHLTVKAPPKFKKKLTDTDTMVSKQIKLSVQVEGSPKPSVQWYKDGLCIKASDRVKLFEEASAEYTLLIEEARLEDAGSYSVVATNEVNQCSDFCKVQIRSPPRFIKGMEKNIETNENDTVTFTVKVEGDPQPSVKWLHNGSTLKSDGKHVKISEDGQTHTLVVSGVSRADSGAYACEASNQYATVADSGVLNVRCAPHFTTKMADRAAKEGDTNVEFTVNVNAFPRPNVQWFHDEVEITEKVTEFTRIEEGDNYKLIIKEVTKELSGKYTCKVVNDLGEDTSSSNLTVSYKPRFRKGLKNVSMDEGDSLTLEVEIEGVPEPTVKWFKNGEEVTGDAHIKITRDSKRIENYSMTFTLVKPEDGGEYEVRASNEMGTTVSQSTVTIHTKTSHVEEEEKEEAPKWTKEEKAEVEEDTVETKKTSEEELGKAKQADMEEGLKPSEKILIEDTEDEERDVFISDADKVKPAGSFSCVEVKLDDMNVEDVPEGSSCLVEEYSDNEDRKEKLAVSRGVSIVSVSEDESKHTLTPDEPSTPKSSFLFEAEPKEGDSTEKQSKVSDGADKDKKRKGSMEDSALQKQTADVNEVGNEKHSKVSDGTDKDKKRKASMEESALQKQTAEANEVDDEKQSKVSDGTDRDKKRKASTEDAALQKQTAEVNEVDNGSNKKQAKVDDVSDKDKAKKGVEVALGDQNEMGASSKEGKAVVNGDMKRKPSVKGKKDILMDEEDLDIEDEQVLNVIDHDDGDIPQKSLKSDVITECDEDGSGLKKPVTSDVTNDDEMKGASVTELNKENVDVNSQKGAQSLDTSRKLSRQGVKEIENQIDNDAKKQAVDEPPVKKPGMEVDAAGVDGSGSQEAPKEARKSLVNGDLPNRGRKSVVDDVDEDGLDPQVADLLKRVQKQRSVLEEILDKEGEKAAEVGPEIICHVMENKEVFESLPTHFEVSIIGNPRPDVKWFKDEKPIEPSDHLAFIEDEKYRMEIQNVKMSDAGTYKCVASNKLGEKTLEAVLSVKPESALRGPKCTTPLKDLKVPKGQCAELTAVFTADPEPEITWTHDGNEVDATFTKSKNIKQLENGLVECAFTLKIPAGRHEDTGNYKIEAKNKFGFDESSARLDIILRPEILTFKDTTVSPPDDTEMIARIIANPKPEVTWIFENKAIKDDSRHTIISDHEKEQYKMQLKSASKADPGIYKIVAKNSEGEATAEAKLKLHTEAPSFVKKITDQEIKEYAQAEFKVRANGMPKPVITWYKNGKELKSGSDGLTIETILEGQVSSTLTIDHFKLDDEGAYSVTAVNMDGEDECSAKLRLAQIAPSFVKGLERSAEVGENEPLELKAKVDGSPLPHVLWFKDGEEVKDDGRRKITVSPDGLVKLTIDSMKPADSGAYKLEITNTNGKAQSICAVVVSNTPKKPAFIKELADTVAVEGQPLVLQAEMEGFPEPKVKWASQNLDFIKTPSGQIGIEIASVKPEDVGQYSVTISNKLGEETSKAKVDVAEKEKKPQFLSQLMPTNVVEGYPAKLEIKISGHPKPELSWFLNGKPINIDGKHIKLISGPDGSECLLIDSVTPADAGEYQVIAKNAQGETSSKAPLTVSSKMNADEPEEKPGFVKDLRDATADEGEPLIFSAPVFGNPIPDVEWSKDGAAIEPSDRILMTFDGHKVGLEINPSKLSDAGSYKCTLSNPLGEAESSAKGVPSMDAKFAARISGLPKPEASWFKDGVPIDSNNAKYRTKVDDDTYSLYVRDVEPADAGRYKCLAANREGKATCEAELHVVDKIEKGPRAEPPTFLKRIGDCEYYHGMKVKFTACVTGYPDPEVEWFRGNEKLYESERIRMEKEDTGLLRLIISIVDPKVDLGRYRCRIFNQHGEDSCEANLVEASLDMKPRKPLGDQYSDFDKFKSSGAPMPLSDRPIISRMTDRKLTLSWKPSIPHGPREPVTYIVEMCELPDGEWFVARRGIRSCVCDIANLEPFRDYKFRIRVENKYGTSDPSPFAITHREKLELALPSFKPYLPPGVDFHPDHSPYFPKDYDIDRPPHDKYAQAPRFLRQEDDTQYGVKNHNCNLFWFVYGYPKPKMEYYFNDELIEMGGRYDCSYTRNGQATLFINKMLDRDVGIYEAVATNEHGQARQRVRLQIAEYPQFLLRPDETTILTRKSGKLVARVVGVPYPEIKWFKDWQPLATSSRIKIAFIPPDTCVLTINDAMVRDEGLYSISARNIAGAISSSVSIHVEENEAEYNYMSYGRGRDIKPKLRQLGDKYDLGDELGRGTQGITYHAVERVNGRSYAAKVMHGKGHLQTLMKNELEIMNQLNHRKLIRLHDAYETHNTFSLVMELAGGGELLDNLTKQTFVTESEIAGYIRQILWGLEHMHDQNIAHLGLTLGDLLISHVGGDDLKICDFGLSRRIPFGKTASLEFGMPEYVSPEIVTGDGVGTPADMWALGIITHILLTGISPFRGGNDRETLTNIRENKWSFREDVWQNLSGEARDFVKLLLVFQQEGRMDVHTALRHPWLNRADKMPHDEFRITTDSLRNYYNTYKDWYANASCRTWFRRQPLETAFTHPSRMVYPPGGIFTPEPTPERTSKDKEPRTKTWEEQISSRDPLHYELGLVKSESHYQNGPDTYLLQLRDVDFPVRLREYMKVAANRTPTGLGFTRENLEKHAHLDWRAPVIRERRRFTDVMDEEIDDERKARINKYGSPDMYTLRRLRNELGTRLDTHLEAEAMIEQRREGHAPFFREKPQVTAIREELPAELSCFAVGDPKPTVQWFKNDLVVAESHRVKIVEDDAGRSMIKFEPALTVDAGIYKAVARNKIGQVVARTSVVLATLPSPPDSPEVSEISDTEVLLRWKLPRDNGNSPILCYNLQYKEADSSEWTDVASNIDHEFWVIRNLRPSTAHQFRLSARNNIGWSAKGVPTEPCKTKDAGAPKISVTSAMKHYQTACESGKEIDLEEQRIHNLNYEVESAPIEWDDAKPTNKYSFISEIARGQFSVVVKGFNKETEEVVVGKILDCSPENKENVMQEFEAMRSLRHERIACLFEAFLPSDSTGAVFIQEKLQGADILTYMASKHEYTEQMVATAVSQVLDALHYLHWRGLCHLDIQPSNIIMASIRSIQVKLVDFGSAQQVTKLGTMVQKTGAL
ncbi:hypothetical protein LSTR_LSTR007219 [Laodelphax striatellus]|uniref:Obscurin n=2 Tax=Laodelphax striatellus TaxID=195883 RepID=A0A482XDT1_LAOST|nr:hypothetical protein LSTR_LSTR007219 [Laodelphax striatellus]